MLNYNSLKCLRKLEAKVLEFWYRPLPKALFFLKAWNCFFQLIYVFNKKPEKLKKLQIPIIIVGNLTVGGTGKTPCIISLINLLKQQGHKPGIISRGYKGSYLEKQKFLLVNALSQVSETGDEALLLYQSTWVPVVLSEDRNLAAQKLVEHYSEITIIISDDGLQHNRLPRSIEILLIDGMRGFGNGLCLPFGPLREPVKRLKTVDLIAVKPPIFQNNSDILSQLKINYLPLVFELMSDLSPYVGKKVHAVTGIANPESFFRLLENLGIQIIRHAFPDHHTFESKDFEFVLNETLPCLITEKDAVKCRHLSNPALQFFIVKMQLKFNENLKQALLNLIPFNTTEN
ncbi:MAG: tetraacyldisaccharide 4'-kinase [Gammaproteobacteria bacterium]